MAAVPLAATVVWLVARGGGALDGRPVTESVEWVPALGVDLDLRLDGFAVLFAALVSGIGVLIVAYSASYLAAAGRGQGRLLGLLVLFAGSMLGLVLADNLIVLFGFWELTSITSFLLIGNDHDAVKARAAALQALLITGAGGLAMLAGVVLIGQAVGRARTSSADPGGPAVGDPGDGRPGAGPGGGVHQVGPVPVPLVAAGGDGGADADQRLPALGHDGEGRRLPDRPVRPGVHGRVDLAAARGHRGPGHDGRRRPAGAAPARPQAHPGLRHDQPARLHGRHVRARDGRHGGGRLRAGAGPRPVQGGAVHGGRHRRPPGRDPRHPPHPPARPAGRPTGGRDAVSAASMAGVPPAFGFVAKEDAFAAFEPGDVRLLGAGAGPGRRWVGAHGRLQPAVRLGALGFAGTGQARTAPPAAAAGWFVGPSGCSPPHRAVRAGPRLVDQLVGGAARPLDAGGRAGAPRRSGTASGLPLVLSAVVLAGGLALFPPAGPSPAVLAAGQRRAERRRGLPRGRCGASTRWPTG